MCSQQEEQTLLGHILGALSDRTWNFQKSYKWQRLKQNMENS